MIAKLRGHPCLGPELRLNYTLPCLLRKAHSGTSNGYIIGQRDGILVPIVNGIAAPPFLIVAYIVSWNRRSSGDAATGGWHAVLGWANVPLMRRGGVVILVAPTRL